MDFEAPGECVVCIGLHGSTRPVTAGRFALSVDRRGTPEGGFVYGRGYLERANAVVLDPVEPKRSARIYARAAWGGVLGAPRDASPDCWGRRAIERHLGKAQPDERQPLLFSPDDRAPTRSAWGSTTRRRLRSAASSRCWIWRRCRPSRTASWPMMIVVPILTIAITWNS